MPVICPVACPSSGPAAARASISPSRSLQSLMSLMSSPLTESVALLLRTAGVIRSSYHFSSRNGSPLEWLTEPLHNPVRALRPDPQRHDHLCRRSLRGAAVGHSFAAGLTWIGGAAQLPVPVEGVRGRRVARRQRQTRERLPVRHRRIAPPARLRFLNPQKRLDAAESLAVHEALEAVPRPLHPAHGVHAGLVTP